MINYAHRGASEYAPENTMSAFHLALELGADGIETDVRETSDGVLVLFHDRGLKRITGENVEIKDLTYKELYSRDLGSYKSRKYANEKVVTLEDFLKYFSAKDIALAIELKSPGIEKRVVELIYQYNCVPKVTVTSFEMQYLKNIRSFDNNIKLGFLTKIHIENVHDELVKNGINQYCPSIDIVTRELVAETHERGMTLRTCCVHTVELMLRAIDYGVDGMTVNFPDILRRELIARGIIQECHI